MNQTIRIPITVCISLEFGEQTPSIPAADQSLVEFAKSELKPKYSASNSGRIRGTHGHSEKLTKEERERMKEFHAEGATVPQLALRFGVTSSTVSYHVNKDIREYQLRYREAKRAKRKELLIPMKTVPIPEPGNSLMDVAVQNSIT